MRRIALLPLVVLCAACTTVPDGQRSTKPATGPPEVRPETIEEHARQFDEEEPLRPAGSQQEFAASAYIVAHLTDAGYVSRLDAVPVADAVRSTNVVALPPSGEEPDAIVAVAYDSTEGSPPGGMAIATWLEVARALRAMDPEHSIQFVALGAEHAPVEGGLLGSRRLARQLTDKDRSPPIVFLAAADDSQEVVTAGGPLADVLETKAVEEGIEARAGSATAGAGEVFDAAGFDYAVLGGDAETLGRVLLAYLSGL